MKRYFYIILTAFCELLSLSSIRNYSRKSSELLRILYLEKSALFEFDFNPFPLFVMLCFLMKTILAIIFITSNIPTAEIIISRFCSRKNYFIYLIGKISKKALFCSLAVSILPAVLTALLCGFSDVFRIAILYFLRQFILLFFASGASIILRKKLNSGAADISAAMLVIVLVMIDFFADFSAALIDLTAQNLFISCCEIAACLCFIFVCYAFYKRRKDIF